MICITGSERTVETLAQRLEAHRQFSLQEVRLDLLERIDEQVYPLLRSPGVVVTCRSVSEGGAFRGSESERLHLLARALVEEPGYVDLELSTTATFRHEVFACRGKTRLILSVHHYAADREYLERAGGMQREEADLLKVAVTVEDAADLAPLRRCLSDEERPVLRIGMGDAGLLSRALFSRFGSPWTYVVPDGSPAVAPGQLSVSECRAFRVEEAEHLTPLGLLGGPVVLRSPGPQVYNRLFAARGLPFVYLPVVTGRPLETLDLLQELGFGGASVTMPAKERLVSCMDELASPAEEARAVNTVLLGPGGRVGLNTDVHALHALLADQPGVPALVLGAGGAARAAVVALRSLQCPVAVSARDPEKAATFAASFGVPAVPWEDRGRHAFAVLVNATPCGTDGALSPMPPDVGWTGRTALDMVLSRDGSTSLLAQVTRGGGRAIPGTEMWLHQGARQMASLVGAPISVEELRRFMVQAPAAEPPGHGEAARDG
jgi:3-dehydroquinate dehydratase/shikimate dehydrogenase